MESISTVSTVQWFMRADRTLGSQPIALEVGVEVSGTRAAAGAGTRELFSERTKTTLVFENGAVVRLSAAVEVGQLLFLKHFDSQQEIVARVLRQRSSGSASAAYIELEFTDAVPGFWGELPLFAEEEVSGPAAQELAAAAQFLAEEAAAGELALTAAKPNDGEVVRLREEIAGLRLQMSSLVGSAKPAEAEKRLTPAVVIEDEFRAGNQDEQFAALEAAHADEGTAAAAETAAAAPAAGARRIPYWMISAALIVAVLAGAAYYEGLFKNLPGKWKLTAGASSAPASKRGASPVELRPAAVSAARGPVTKDVATAAAKQSEVTSTNGGAEAGATPDAARDSEMNARDTRGADGGMVAGEAPSQKREAVPKNQGNRHDILRSGDAKIADAAGSADDAYNPPSLIKSVNPVAPPEAVREFVTGDVKCDAFVDATGRVASAKVISGPAALHAAALEALRLFQYKPATKNGRAVAAHVEATLKFWYEP